MEFNYEIVNQALTLLDSEEHIIRKTFSDNNIRYVIRDQNLHQLIEVIGHLFVDEMSMLNCKWRNFRPPTEEESDRLEWLVGKDMAKIIVNTAELYRYENKIARESKRADRRSKNVEEFIKHLKRGNVDNSNMIFLTSSICLTLYAK